MTSEPFENNKKLVTNIPTRLSKTTNSKLPSELLILNRYGVGYPYLSAAWKLSKKSQIPVFEILIKAKVISLETWLDSQDELRKERENYHLKLSQQTFLLDQSINNLSSNLPYYSAKTTFHKPQLILILLIVAIVVFFTFNHTEHAMPVFFVFFTCFYSAMVLLRGYLLSHYEPEQTHSYDLIPSNDDDLPIYSVLVALYKESNQIEQLTQNLWGLDWPKEKLDIKLICEADDLETITAIENAKLPACFELILVPPAKPRTKPKALNYALPLCHGEYLVLYDAEDMPSPGQLRQAYLKFQYEDEKLICLQAPLRIHNHKQNWLTSMFAIEYITLFNGMLPILANWGVPIPLGGTSNHFKLKELKEIGGWDPYNVTEDADLGIRLFREGYKSSTITLPTYEEAPPRFIPWIKQRTRWLKGWMQTILVHNRNPIHFITDLGFKNAIAFHLLITSIVISMLIHPFFIVATLIHVLNMGSIYMSNYDGILNTASIFNLVGGYTTYALLAYAVLQKSQNKPASVLLFTLPIYWLMISLAGWRALVHLILMPHRWEKTPHGLAK